MSEKFQVVPAKSPVLSIVNNHVITTSLNIADTFGKHHSVVLKAVRSLDVPKAFTEVNFDLSEYIDSTGRNLPMYRITRDGFAILAMGFTGKKAMQFKLAYISAFNKMEAELIRRTGAYHAPGSYPAEGFRKNVSADSLPDGMKRCPTCREILPATTEFFHRDAHDRSGLHAYCIPCRHKQYEQDKVKRAPRQIATSQTNKGTMIKKIRSLVKVEVKKALTGKR